MVDPVLARQDGELAERRQRLTATHRISVRSVIAGTLLRTWIIPAWARSRTARSVARSTISASPLRRRASRPEAGCHRIESVFGVFMGRS